MSSTNFEYNVNLGWLEEKVMSELILSGKAKDEQEAAEIAELETEQKKSPKRKDIKTGVA